MIVALYARVSTAGQDPDNQVVRLRAAAEARGYEIQGVYIDVASGADARRPELDRMLASAKLGEVLRLRPEDIREDYIMVKGKGPLGGKPRRIPFHRDTARVMALYARHRDGLIAEARRRYPKSTVVPDSLIIRIHGGRLYEYEEDGWGWDKSFLIPLREACGFHFTNHTLRRTFGRALWQAGVPVETISKLLGHDTTEVTLRYIGVDMDHMRSAMEACPI